MKIEMLESLGYSYLRHVKQCWLVQANWKVSAHWTKHVSNEQLEGMFESMREQFDRDGSVLKKTKDAEQFLKQGEIDVVGVGQDGSVHALDVAFHEAGLNYGSGPDKRVLKKLLRAVVILKAYVPAGTKSHVYFVSPKVNPGVQQRLEDIFESLAAAYPEIEWDLLTNEAFAEQMLGPTLEKAGAVADDSELFMRAKKLLDLAETPRKTTRRSDVDTLSPPSPREYPDRERGSLQPLVRNLMTTLLEDHPTLLDEADLRNLMDLDFCKNSVGLQLGNFPLLRGMADGRKGSDSDGLDRYYRRLYAGRFYVCSQWWRAHHLSNGRSLLQFVNGLAQRKPNHPGMPALELSQKELLEYVG